MTLTFDRLKSKYIRQWFFTIVIRNVPEDLFHNLFELLSLIIKFGGVITIFHTKTGEIVTNSSKTSISLLQKSGFKLWIGTVTSPKIFNIFDICYTIIQWNSVELFKVGKHWNILNWNKQIQNYFYMIVWHNISDYWINLFVNLLEICILCRFWYQNEGNVVLSSMNY